MWPMTWGISQSTRRVVVFRRMIPFTTVQLVARAQGIIQHRTMAKPARAPTKCARVNRRRH